MDTGKQRDGCFASCVCKSWPSACNRWNLELGRPERIYINFKGAYINTFKCWDKRIHSHVYKRVRRKINTGVYNYRTELGDINGDSGCYCG